MFKKLEPNLDGICSKMASEVPSLAPTTYSGECLRILHASTPRALPSDACPSPPLPAPCPCLLQSRRRAPIPSGSHSHSPSLPQRSPLPYYGAQPCLPWTPASCGHSHVPLPLCLLVPSSYRHHLRPAMSNAQHPFPDSLSCLSCSLSSRSALGHQLPWPAACKPSPAGPWAASCADRPRLAIALPLAAGQALRRLGSRASPSPSAVFVRRKKKGENELETLCWVRMRSQ